MNTTKTTQRTFQAMYDTDVIVRVQTGRKNPDIQFVNPASPNWSLATYSWSCIRSPQYCDALNPTCSGLLVVSGHNDWDIEWAISGETMHKIGLWIQQEVL